jgi:hypothetical protein
MSFEGVRLVEVEVHTGDKPLIVDGVQALFQMFDAFKELQESGGIEDGCIPFVRVG